jgi:hypothetical protein
MALFSLATIPPTTNIFNTDLIRKSIRLNSFCLSVLVEGLHPSCFERGPGLRAVIGWRIRRKLALRKREYTLRLHHPCLSVFRRDIFCICRSPLSGDGVMLAAPASQWTSRGKSIPRSWYELHASATSASNQVLIFVTGSITAQPSCERPQ